MATLKPSKGPSHAYLLQLPAHAYQALLNTKELTSEDLVIQFLDQIGRHNTNGLELRAISSVCPRQIALTHARALDEERRNGRLRSDLHGIPIILKDAIVTSPSLGMKTSAGSTAIASLKAKRNATVVEKLLEAGVIVLGKLNLTELCGMKSDNTPIGWSAYGGQTLSPYRRIGLGEDDQAIPGGSSVGSAVSIAAGFAPLALGTETGGSNVFPASLGSLYGLNLPHGSISLDGVHRISESYDRLSLMARDPRDIEMLVEIKLGQDAELEGNEKAGKSLEGLSIGVLDSKWGTDASAEWKWGSEEVKQKYASAAVRMEQLGARVVFPLENAPQPSVLQYEGERLHSVSYHEFSGLFESFIAANFEHDTSLTNLADLVAWNQANANMAMPEPYSGQTELIKCLNDTMTPSTHLAAHTELRRLAQEEGLARVMREQEIDIVLSASDASLVSFSSCAGWPVATVPVGNLTKNDQPWGFFALPRDGNLGVLMNFIKGFHRGFERVKGPTTPFEVSEWV